MHTGRRRSAAPVPQLLDRKSERALARPGGARPAARAAGFPRTALAEAAWWVRSSSVLSATLPFQTARRQERHGIRLLLDVSMWAVRARYVLQARQDCR